MKPKCMLLKANSMVLILKDIVIHMVKSIRKISTFGPCEITTIRCRKKLLHYNVFVQAIFN